MRHVITKSLAFIILLGANAVSTVAQVDYNYRWENGISEPWFFDYTNYSKEDAVTIQRRWELIEREAQSITANEWVGDYSIGGDVHETVLRWTPASGFVMVHVYTCLPSVTSLDYGRVVAADGFVQMFSESPKKSSSQRAVHGAHAARPRALKYLPVKWGERHYLIPEKKVSQFYDYVAGLGAYQEGSDQPMEFFLVKRDELGKSVSGMPVLPRGYERFVKRPIGAKISEVKTSYVRPVKDDENPWWNELITTVTIDAGQVSGVKRGMTLYVLGSDSSESVRITRVSRCSATGVIIRSVRKKPGVKVNEWDNGVDKPEPVITVGWELSTSPLSRTTVSQ